MLFRKFWKTEVQINQKLKNLKFWPELQMNAYVIFFIVVVFNI